MAGLQWSPNRAAGPARPGPVRSAQRSAKLGGDNVLLFRGTLARMDGMEWKGRIQ